MKTMPPMAHSQQCNYGDSPSLDRIFPESGYTKGNVRVISWRANWIKNNSTIEEIEKLYIDSQNIKSMKK